MEHFGSTPQDVEARLFYNDIIAEIRHIVKKTTGTPTFELRSLLDHSDDELRDMTLYQIRSYRYNAHILYRAHQKCQRLRRASHHRPRFKLASYKRWGCPKRIGSGRVNDGPLDCPVRLDPILWASLSVVLETIF
jgi:hypothetical protein